MTRQTTNKAIVHRFVRTVINQKDMRLVDELVAPDVISHSQHLRGREGYKQMLASIFRAFPDLHMTVEELIGEGDLLALRARSSHTHLGEFMGLAPTGIQGEHTTMLFLRLRDGQLAAVWEESDMLGLLQQLGAVTINQNGAHSP